MNYGGSTTDIPVATAIGIAAVEIAEGGNHRKEEQVVADAG